MECQVWGINVEGEEKGFLEAQGTLAFRGFSRKQRADMRLGDCSRGESGTEKRECFTKGEVVSFIRAAES